jgi:hypothetical protein
MKKIISIVVSVFLFSCVHDKSEKYKDLLDKHYADSCGFIVGEIVQMKKDSSLALLVYSYGDSYGVRYENTEQETVDYTEFIRYTGKTPYSLSFFTREELQHLGSPTAKVYVIKNENERNKKRI